MAETELRSFRDDDRQAVIDLWRRCDLTRPWNDPDLDRTTGHDDGLRVAADGSGSVIGSVMAGDDGHRGWINYLAVDPGHRRDGFGAAAWGRLMAAAEELLAAAPRSTSRSVRATRRPSPSTVPSGSTSTRS